MKKPEQLYVCNLPESVQYHFLAPYLEPAFSEIMRSLAIYHLQKSPRPVVPVFPENAPLTPDLSGLSAPLPLLSPETGLNFKAIALSQPDETGGYYFAVWPKKMEISMEFLRQISRILTEHGTNRPGTDSGNLIAQLLHDMNTLLDYAEQGLPVSSEKKQYYHSMMRDLLFYIRQPEIFIETFRLSALFPAVLEYASIPAERLMIRHESPGIEIAADTELLAMAIKALLSNAFESMTGKSGQVKIDTMVFNQKHPFINSRWLKLIISDNGCSIPADYSPFLFQPFFTTKKSSGQAGFGLALTKKIIELHNGFIEIYSEKETGTAVHLYLPLIDL